MRCFQSTQSSIMLLLYLCQPGIGVLRHSHSQLFSLFVSCHHRRLCCSNFCSQLMQLCFLFTHHYTQLSTTTGSPHVLCFLHACFKSGNCFITSSKGFGSGSFLGNQPLSQCTRLCSQRRLLSFQRQITFS